MYQYKLLYSKMLFQGNMKSILSPYFIYQNTDAVDKVDDV